MASPFRKEDGTLIVAAVLIASLGFAGYWIISYVRDGRADWSVASWFVAAVGLIVVVGIAINVLAGRSARR